MSQVSQATMDAIQKAEDDRDAATQADAAHQTTVDALAAATASEGTAAQKSIDAHKTALGSANAAIDALKKELGLPVTPA